MFQRHLRRAAVAQPEKFHTCGGLACIHVSGCIRQARRYAGFDAKQSSLMEISKRSRAQRISALRQHENLFAAGTSNIGTWLVDDVAFQLLDVLILQRVGAKLDARKLARRD
jgi:hypothetical protein